MRPVKEVIFVETIEQKEVDGIIIPDSALKKPLVGKVVCAGENHLGLVEGDHVVHYQDAGVKMTVDGEEYLIMKTIDLLATIAR